MTRDPFNPHELPAPAFAAWMDALTALENFGTAKLENPSNNGLVFPSDAVPTHANLCLTYAGSNA